MNKINVHCVHLLLVQLNMNRDQYCTAFTKWYFRNRSNLRHCMWIIVFLNITFYYPSLVCFIDWAVCLTLWATCSNLKNFMWGTTASNISPLLLNDWVCVHSQVHACILCVYVWCVRALCVHGVRACTCVCVCVHMIYVSDCVLLSYINIYSSIQ